MERRLSCAGGSAIAVGVGEVALGVGLAAAQAGTPAPAKGLFADPVRVVCPVNQTTTVVFPEPLRQLRGLGSETASLGLSIERTKPRGVVAVRPTTHPARGTVEFRGPTLSIRIVFETAGDGTGKELRLDREGVSGDAVLGVEEKPEAAPSPAQGEPGPHPAAVSAPGTATNGPHTPVPSSSAAPTGGLDLAGILNARPLSIDRREGLPGQRPMVLVDALHGEQWTWLRFRLEDGAGSRIERVSWEHGDITSYVQEPTGEDLRVVVQVPRALVNKKTRVSLRVESGPVYKFALTPSTLPSFIKRVFE